MEKTSTMKQARTSVLVALALICVVSCAKIDDESSAVAPEQPARPTVLLPTRSYEEALSLARKSIALGRPGPDPLGPLPVRSAANAANASLPRPRAAAPGATL